MKETDVITEVMFTPLAVAAARESKVACVSRNLEQWQTVRTLPNLPAEFLPDSSGVLIFRTIQDIEYNLASQNTPYLLSDQLQLSKAELFASKRTLERRREHDSSLVLDLAVSPEDWATPDRLGKLLVRRLYEASNQPSNSRLENIYRRIGDIAGRLFAPHECIKIAESQVINIIESAQLRPFSVRHTDTSSQPDVS